MSLIWILSDTHTLHNKLTIPEVDMVIHCGDAANSPNMVRNCLEMGAFAGWFGDLPIKHKVFIPGNHDVAMQEPWIKNECDFHILIHDYLEIEGLRIFGSPYTPKFGNWAFNVRRDRLHEYWQQIPECDILVTHGPRRFRQDLTYDLEHNNKLVQAGDAALGKRIDELKDLKYHIFGHVHNEKNIINAGVFRDNHYTSVNAACYNHYKKALDNNGFVISV